MGLANAQFRLSRTDVRQYTILSVTVKLGGEFSKVEHVLVLGVCRRGVGEFAASEPLAYEVAADLQPVAFQFVGGVAWRAGDLQFPQLPVSFGFDGRYRPFSAARAGCGECVWRGLELAVAVWACADQYHVFLRSQGLVVASDDALQLTVVVFDGWHGEYGMPVGEYSLPCFVPAEVGVGCVDFACGFGEPLAACVDEVAGVLVEGQGRIA